MKIKLKDLNGKVTQEVDVDDAFGELMVSLDKEEDASNKRYKYHIAFSLDDATYEGDTFKSNEPDPLNKINEKEELENQQRRYDLFISSLTPTQKRRFLLFEDGKSEREVARIEGVDFKSIHETKEQLKKKYIKLFGDPHQKKWVFSYMLRWVIWEEKMN